MEPVSSGTNRSGNLSRQQTGAGYEQQARRLLENAGLTFVAANVRYRAGEIDLIMRDRMTWVFVEVRYRRNALFGGAAASVTRSKQQKLLHAAALWLRSRNSSLETTDCRFDVVAITGTQVDWLSNAFTAE
ncbi:YraN family protein [Erwinia sp. MMLR14_017]|uniref:YraN family protein n=1 Tax=Erwinia sp. MMLR14_017 TaxID=3093842 RepID=UPI0029905398|nr:YraN family protein [Erwinia sp. MMLR14_017]MDW8844524.1 YraN family protein [Erwinia sp. MMLR14_017]